MCCPVLICADLYCPAMLNVAVVLLCAAVCCSVSLDLAALLCSALCCSVLLCVAPCFNVLPVLPTVSLYALLFVDVRPAVLSRDIPPRRSAPWCRAVLCPCLCVCLWVSVCVCV